MNNPTKNPNVLYRFFDASDRLLYIGISNSFENRLSSHEKNAVWFKNAARVALEHYPDRETVEAAEKKAIKKELPLHNRTHHPLYQQPVQHWRTLTGAFSILDDHHKDLMEKTRSVHAYLSEQMGHLEDINSDALGALAFFETIWELYGGETMESPCVSCDKLCQSDFLMLGFAGLESTLFDAEKHKRFDFDLVMGNARGIARGINE